MSLPTYTTVNQLAHSEGEVMYVHDSVSGVLRVPDTHKDFGGTAFTDFSGNLGTGLNDELVIENTCGHSSVGFHVQEIDGGVVQFRACYDGEHHSPVQMRELSSNGYTQSTDHSEDFLGSISCVKHLVFRRTTASTAVTPIAGRMSKDAATLEGIENANPPHRFGNELFHRGFSLDNAMTGNMDLFTPPSGNKFVLTYISFGLTSTAGANVTFHESQDTGVNPNNWVFSTYVKTNANETQFFNIALPTPFVASGLNNHLHFSTDASVTMRGVIHGYNTTV